MKNSMKRKLNLAALCAVLFSAALVMTGCEAAEALSIPEDTWCSATVDYGKENETATQKVNVHIYYSESTLTVGDESYDAGLTVIITPHPSSDNAVINALTGAVYATKHFPKNGGNGGDDGFSLTGNKATATLLYLSKSEFQKNQSKESPVTRNSLTSLLDWESLKDDFSWERLLINYLESSLKS